MKKSSLFMFLDYLLVLFLSVFGIFIFSWMLEFSWGYPVYSVIFTLVFFGMIYSRSWKTAKKELKNKERVPKLTDGILVALPFAIFNVVVIIAFALVFYNIIPIRDNVVNIFYSFEPNEARVRNEVTLIENLIPIVRIWFAPFIGFMQTANKTSPLIMLLSPVLTIGASVLGYFLGMKKYYISDSIVNVTEKVKEKFNE